MSRSKSVQPRDPGSQTDDTRIFAQGSCCAFRHRLPSDCSYGSSSCRERCARRRNSPKQAASLTSRIRHSRFVLPFRPLARKAGVVRERPIRPIRKQKQFDLSHFHVRPSEAEDNGNHSDRASYYCDGLVAMVRCRHCWHLGRRSRSSVAIPQFAVCRIESQLVRCDFRVRPLPDSLSPC